MILRRLGQGGMGAVYQAQDTRLVGKLWAIKEMSDAQLSDPAERANAVAAFRREAQLLATLDHANLPKVSDFFEEAGKEYLVMDFVQGQTLAAVIETTSGFLEEARVLDWMAQLCDVLDYLHTRQPPIIFRDLKPDNIMLTPDNKIKLIDFGIARFFQPGKSKDTALYGTMGYASPEQFGTGQTDARSDIYSLGVTLHHLLTKYDPSRTPFNLPQAHNINSSISIQTENVITKATQAAPLERFQSVREMQLALFVPTSKPQSPLPKIQAPIANLRSPAPAPPGMILIPAGEFMMGSNEEDDESPIHRVHLAAFYIDQYPVTNLEYKKFVDATKHRTPSHWKNRQIPPGKENHPVVNVSWHDASDYCRWTGKRLPTEAEWEKAARGIDGRIYPWGNEQPDASRCNFDEDISDTTPVGKYSPHGDSPYGCADMAGNMWEWVSDWYNDSYYSESPANNPDGPAGGQYRVCRGGSWSNSQYYIRTAMRDSDFPYSHGNDVGFRCAQ